MRLRLSGITPNVDTNTIASTIAEISGCRPSIKVGEFRQSRNMGTVLVRCPVGAANKVARTGHMTIGWNSRTKVELLTARPLQCFKCLQGGHVRAKCPNQDDRSGNYYRCGCTGHVARECTAQAHCIICDAASKPASHRMTCKPPKDGAKKGSGAEKGGGSGAKPAQPPLPIQEREGHTGNSTHIWSSRHADATGGEFTSTRNEG